MTNPVSIVIPTFNHAAFLGRALDSVRAQTQPAWEALVVDNHSQDHTESIVRAYDDPRIRLFKIHNHGVIAASRNLGVRHARYDWIAFLDSDDCWYPKKLEVVMAAANAGCDVVCNDELMVDVITGAKRVLRHGPYETDFYRALLVDGNRLSTSATVVRREFIARHQIAFDESTDRVTVEDYGFWLDLARAGARFTFVPQVEGEFVIHGTNNSARLSQHLMNAETLLRDHVFTRQQFESSPDRLWQLVSSRLRLWEVRHLVVERQFGRAFLLAMKTLGKSPTGTCRHLLSRLKVAWHRPRS